MTQREPRLVVFDWDGTLMASTARIVSCLAAATESMGMPRLADSAYRDIIGLGVQEATRRLFPERAADAAFVDAFSAAYRRRYLDEDATPTPMYPGAVELVRRLAARPDTLVAVATGKSRAGLNRALSACGLADAFYATATTSEHPSKPSPAMLEWLMARAGVERERVWMIGDSRFDMAMARAAGVTGWGVTHGVHDAEALLAEGAARVFDGLPSVGRALDSRPVAA